MRAYTRAALTSPPRGDTRKGGIWAGGVKCANKKEPFHSVGVKLSEKLL